MEESESMTKKVYPFEYGEKVITAEFFPQTLLTNSKMTLLGIVKKPLMISLCRIEFRK